MNNLWNEFSRNLSIDEWDALYSALHHQIESDEYAVEDTKDPERRDAYAQRLETLKNIWNKLGFND